ncbi:MAG: hypothetical protein IPG02_20625 [Ignavibacteria bacterium]|nr:hypothetical protein [Ignavibacteria bacterium]
MEREMGKMEMEMENGKSKKAFQQICICKYMAGVAYKCQFQITVAI